MIKGAPLLCRNLRLNVTQLYRACVLAVNKMSSKESSTRVEFVTSPSSPPIADLSEVNTDEADNYDGLHAKTALVYLVGGRPSGTTAC